MFNSAIEDGILKENSAAKLGKFYRHAGKLYEEIQSLTREEVRLLLGAVRHLYPEHYPLFLCAIHTVMRAGELAGLQWGHSTIKMTVDVYGQLVPGANRQAVNRLPSLAVQRVPAAAQ